MRPERLDIRPERLVLRPERLDLRTEKLDLRPERLDLRPEGSDEGGTNGRTNRRTNGRTKVPPCSTGLRPLRSRCPKREEKSHFFLRLLILTTRLRDDQSMHPSFDIAFSKSLSMYFVKNDSSANLDSFVKRLEADKNY